MKQLKNWILGAVCVALCVCLVLLVYCRGRDMSAPETDNLTESTTDSSEPVMNSSDPSSDPSVDFSEPATDSSEPNDTQDTTPSDPQPEDPFLILDQEFQAAYDAAISKLELCNIYEAYAQKWSDILDEYYEKLLSISSEPLKQALTAEREEWQEYVQLDIDQKLAYYEQLYQGGSIVPLCMSKYVYDLYREKALQIYEMYIALDALPE